MITLADIPLTLPTAEVNAKIDGDIALSRMAMLYGRSWPGFGMVGLATPTHYRPWPPPVELGRFWWPSGASRYAIGYFLAHVDQVDALHDAAFGSSGTMQKNVDLIISAVDPVDDSIIEKVKTSVAVLPPIPLYRVLNDDGSSDNGMYLITVVDPRYYWWTYPVDDFGITETAGKTWQSVFDSIATTLGITINVGTIDSRYLQPSRAINLTNEPTPPLLDAACANIAHVLIRDYSGKVSTQPFSVALKAWKDEQSSVNGMARMIRAGGPRFLDSY